MLSTRPISDFQNIAEDLMAVNADSPMVITKDDEPALAVVSIDVLRQYERMLAEQKLLEELEIGLAADEAGDTMSLDEAWCKLEEWRHG